MYILYKYSSDKKQSFFNSTSHDSGDGEIRTLDPLLARQVLSQLSYTPILNPASTRSPMPSPA